MHKLRRRSLRQHHCRAAKIQSGGDAPARDCLLIDISKGGVRLNVEGIDVPDEFVLLLSNDGTVQESTWVVSKAIDLIAWSMARHSSELSIPATTRC